MSNAHNIIEIASLQRGENRFHLSPDDQARAAIAERLGEPGVGGLRGDFVLTPFDGGVTVDLHISGRARRICVASLEAMTENIDERFTIRFERGFEEDVDAIYATDNVVREPLDGPTLDLDELLVQHLALALSPHPRKDGAASLAETYKDPVNLSPFSVLKGIVDGDA